MKTDLDFFIGRSKYRKKIQDRTVVLSFYANQLKYLRSLEPGLRVQGFPMECYAVKEPDIYGLTMRVCLFRDRLNRENIG